MLLASRAGIALLLQSSLSAAHLLGRAVCNRDNCLRAIVASNAAPGTSVAQADCSRYLLTTVTACAGTATAATPTSTVIVTSTVTVNGAAKVKRDAQEQKQIDVADLIARAATATCPSSQTPSAVPTYASACSGYARYSSACSCNGITGGITTTTPIAQTITPPAVTATSTTIVTVTKTQLCNTFYAVVTAGSYAGTYARLKPATDPSDFNYNGGQARLQLQTDPTQALAMVLQSDGTVTETNGDGTTSTALLIDGDGFGGSYFNFPTQQQPSGYSYPRIQCSVPGPVVNGGYYPLSCTAQLYSQTYNLFYVFNGDNGQLTLGSAAGILASAYQLVDVRAHFVC